MGAADARLFVEDSAKVIGGVNTADCYRLTALLSDSAASLELDVTDPQSWESVLDVATAR
jgi:NADP-dependent 3-hydroxy acid dehydrogenase YdfG